MHKIYFKFYLFRIIVIIIIYCHINIILELWNVKTFLCSKLGVKKSKYPTTSTEITENIEQRNNTDRS